MLAVLDLHAEEHRDQPRAVRLFHRDVVDVGVGVGDRRRNVGEQAAAVGQKQPHAGIEFAFHIRCPFDVDQLIGIDALLF